MELSCDQYQKPQVPALDPRARVFTPRRAAVVAAQRIKDIAEEEEEIS